MGLFDSQQITRLTEENKKLKQIIESYNDYLEKQCGYNLCYYEYGVIGDMKELLEYVHERSEITSHTKHEICNYVVIGGRKYNTENSRYNTVVKEAEILKEKYLKSKMANCFFRQLLYSMGSEEYSRLEELWNKNAKKKKIENAITLYDLSSGLECIGSDDLMDIEYNQKCLEQYEAELKDYEGRDVQGQELIEKRRLIRRIERTKREIQDKQKQDELLKKFETFIDNHYECYGKCDTGNDKECAPLRKLFNPPEEKNYMNF